MVSFVRYNTIVHSQTPNQLINISSRVSITKWPFQDEILSISEYKYNYIIKKEALKEKYIQKGAAKLLI